MEDILRTFDLTPLDAQMILICAVLFVGLVSLLRRNLFSPYLVLLEARENATSGAYKQVEQIKAQSENLNNEYDTQMVDERVAAMKVKLSKIAASKREAQNIIEKAQNNAEQIIKESRASLRQELDVLRKESLQEVQELSNLTVQQILTSADSTAGLRRDG